MRLANLSARERFLFVTLVPVIVAIMIYGLVLRPQMETMTHQRQQLSQIEQNLAQAEQRARILPALRGEVRRLEWDMQELYRVVPLEAGMPDVLVQVNAIARDTNVELIRFSPGVSQEQGDAYGVPVDITVAGGTADIRIFLRTLQSRGRLLVVRSVTMTSDQTALPLLSVQVQLLAFHF